MQLWVVTVQFTNSKDLKTFRVQADTFEQASIEAVARFEVLYKGQDMEWMTVVEKSAVLP